MVYDYNWISSDKHTVENQRFGIANFARANNLQDGWIEENISGMKNYGKGCLASCSKK